MVSFPLPVSVHIAPGANPAAASTYQYTEITSDVRYAGGIAIQCGQQDEGSKADTASHKLTLDNRSGNYSRRNPLGTWYGQLRSGTPVQTRVKLIDDGFARTVASGLGTDPASGQAWTASSSWSCNGTTGLVAIATVGASTGAVLATVCGDEVDVLKCTSLSAVMTGAAWVDATYVRYQDTSNHIRVHTEYSTGSVISVKVTQVDAGVSTDILATAATAVGYSAGTKIRTRVQAIGPTIRVKVWLDSGSEPAAWTAAVDASSTTARGNAVGLFAWRVGGNTNAGTLTETIYEYRVDAIQATTSVPEWSPRWNQTSSNATTPIAGAGILRRLGTGASALRSPMYRLTTGYSNLVGYWPIEDGGSASQLTNTVSTGQPGTLSGMQLGATGPAGSAGAATFSNSDPSSKVSGRFLPASGTAGWQISWSMKLAALPSSSTQMLAWSTSNGYAWAINLNTGVYVVTVVDPGGSGVVSLGTGFTGTGDPNQWVTFRMKATVSGGTVSWAFAWFVQGASTPFGISGTFAGSVGALSTWTANGNASMVNGNICHVFGLTTANDNLQSYAALRSFDGYVGETAGNRAIRLAGEEGVPIVVMGNPDSSAPMGAQTPDTFLNLERECEDADQALLIERGAGLGFLTYEFRTNVPVTMALDFSSGHVADPPEPTDDDQQLVNVVNLTRKGGSEVTAQNQSSVLLAGTYSTDLTVNLQTDAQLSDHAGWRLHMGTIDELRWPRITLQLHANPSLIYTWCAMRIGSRITIANPPSQIAGSSLDLIVIGYTETITPFTWDVELNCAPAQPWDVGVYNSSLTGSSSTTTGSTLAAVTGSGQSLTLTYTTPADRWSTTGTPYPIKANGEVMTVTAMAAASGSTPAISQVATVTRAVNGIAVAHVVGETVQVYPVGRYSI